ncbi:MAG: bifunctional 2-polyprenyl-6-hydroxyphenol methylase/3-demethylubiquinol 3-O-methyltransferase UbiG, partial [Rhodospirillales bacterium]|nr:bifunctional 2-polyprenyl-6-hydroxyphenol methylase/3-demethylubiquinol 3-O-methyltransferase UbiG [Rhodospirillales bacterium]
MTPSTDGTPPPPRQSGDTGTASPEEVARFAAMAEEWWDPNGKFRPLHRFNPVRLGFIRDHICAHYGRDPLSDGPLSGLSLLDIGCGGGLVAEPMANLGADVTGIDAAERNVGTAAAHAAESGAVLTYRRAQPEDLAAEGRQFDVVLNLEVVEHVPDMDVFLGLSASLVKPGGVMVLATLNRTLKALALAKIGAEYVLRWLPPGTHDWNKFVKPSELAAALRPHGVTVTDLKGMTFNPFRDDWSLSSDLDVNYLAFAVK